MLQVSKMRAQSRERLCGFATKPEKADGERKCLRLAHLKMNRGGSTMGKNGAEMGDLIIIT